MSSSWKLESSQTIQRPLVVELGQRATDVPRHGRGEHLAEKRGRRRLAVRPGHAEDRRRQQSAAELDLAPDRNAAPAGGGDERCLRRHPGALDQDVDSLQQRGLLGSEVDFDAGRGEPPDVGLRRAVDGDDAVAVPGERQRRSLAGAREPEDERSSLRRGRGGRPGSSGSRARTPRAQRIAATIQKRTMIFVSDQAFISKWWWIGAIRKIRRPQYLNEMTCRITESASITKMPADQEQQQLALAHDREARRSRRRSPWSRCRP